MMCSGLAKNFLSRQDRARTHSKKLSYKERVFPTTHYSLDTKLRNSVEYRAAK